MYLFDEKFRLILDFVDKVIWCPHICLCLAEAHQRPLGDTFRHRCLADHEDVFDNGLVPYRLLFFKRFGRNGAVLQSGAVNAISHVKRVQARLELISRMRLSGVNTSSVTLPWSMKCGSSIVCS